MDHERSSTSDADKVMDDVMLPGFRFHPTDEELVGFYLKRKIQQRPLSIELIKQLDIYKYDPWDLPKLAGTGEKEWYFYCPRDRKYRNSARPNRVTGAGFWKATGTDRPIYSSEGTKCIGLKKSLVFYKGRAAKGVKTDWMMHEFRLPSLTDHDHSKRSLDKSFPANDSWAICRIFKKTNSTAQRALSHSWVSPSLPEPTSCDVLLASKATINSHFSSETSNKNISLTPKTSTTSSANHFCSSNNSIQNSSPNSTTPNTNTTFSPVDFVPYKPYHNPINLSSSADYSPNLLFPPLETTSGLNAKPIMDNITPSMWLNISSILGNNHFGSTTANKASHHEDHLDLISGLPSQEHCNNNGFSNALSAYDHMLQGHLGNSISPHDHHDHDQWEAVRSLGLPFNLPALPLSTVVADPWKPSMIWDSLPCPTEMSTNFPSSKCYTWSKRAS